MSDLSRRGFILTGSAALTAYLAKAEGTHNTIDRRGSSGPYP